MYFDGAFSLQGAGAGVLLVAPTGEHLKYVVQMHFPRETSMNNTAEYEGLLVGLRIAADLGIKKLIVGGDSQLVVKQVNKDYQSPLMKAYIDEVRKLEERLDGIQAEHVPRADNDITDYLSKSAALKLPVEPGSVSAMSEGSDSHNRSEEQLNLSEGTSPSGSYDEGSRSTPRNLPKVATRQRKKRTSESEDEDFVVEEEVTSKKKVLKPQERVCCCCNQA
nr:uncharacterized protein Mb2253c-like [Aegilops tauschii subsp. strangulata]